ncbi:MAG: polyprenol monophosphomannose synthase [Chloroflexi bacterium]|nr:polyprenol monophosphomannose synthase [Chloroflexota bacterium]
MQTVVVPTYNEAPNLPHLVERLFALNLPDLRLLIVDDHSPDGTGEVAERLAWKHRGRVQVMHRAGKMGLGTAYVSGFQRALKDGADFVVQMDADLSHQPHYVPGLLRHALDYDVVVGSRYVRGGSTDLRWGATRRLLSHLGNDYCRWVGGLTVKDATSGFKCFRRAALERLDLSAVRSQGFAFQVEMAYLCQRAGLKVLEIPIAFPDRSRGRSKMSGRIVGEALLRVPEMRWRHRAADRARPSRPVGESTLPG